MATDSDVSKALRGDADAFGELVLEHQSSLRGFIAMLGARGDDVDDVAQEAFFRAYKALSQYDPARSFGRWIRGFARNLVRERRREARREQSVHRHAICALLENRAETSAAVDAESRSGLGALRECLKGLSARAGELIRMRYLDGRNSAQMGRTLRRDPAAVRVQLGRIRLRLRDCVERRLRTGATA